MEAEMKQRLLKEYDQCLTKLATLMAASSHITDEKRNLLHSLQDLDEGLGESELELIENLSGDLYQLEGKEVLLPTDLNAKEASQKITEAFRKQEWSTLLDQLRRDKPSIPEASRAFLRYRAYLEMTPQMSHAAVAFLRLAARLEGRRNSYLAIWLKAAEDFEPKAVLEEAETIVWDTVDGDARTLVMAASIVQKKLIAESAQGKDNAAQFRDLLSIVLDALSSPSLMFDSVALGLLVASNCTVGLDVQNTRIAQLASHIGQATRFLTPREVWMESYDVDKTIFVAEDLLRELKDVDEKLGTRRRWTPTTAFREPGLATDYPFAADLADLATFHAV